jgi:hypothetical protein
MNVDNDDWDDNAGGMGEDDDEDEDNMDDADDDDNDADIEEILRKRQLEFQDACMAIRRNDPEKTFVYAVDAKGYGIPLGNALVGNTHVAHLNLLLLAEYINSPDDGNWGVHNIALVLQYLREGPAFRTLHIWGGSLQYTSACVHAMAHNPNRMSLIIDDRTEIPLLEIIDLLRTSKLLEDLQLSMVNSTALAEAIQANQSLESLVLNFDPDARPKPNGDMLHHLYSHSKLQRLRIVRKPESNSLDTEQVDVALYSLLCHRSTRLKTLQLFFFTFNRSRMELFIDGLQANRSLEMLELYSCEFDDEVVAHLEYSVLAPTKCCAFLMCPIQELSFKYYDHGRVVALFALGFSNLRILNWGKSYAQIVMFVWIHFGMCC